MPLKMSIIFFVALGALLFKGTHGFHHTVRRSQRRFSIRMDVSRWVFLRIVVFDFFCVNEQIRPSACFRESLFLNDDMNLRPPCIKLLAGEDSCARRRRRRRSWEHPCS